jgi:ABC-type lipoprotein release transport system permease subunit
VTAFRRLRVAIFLAARSLARGNAGVSAMSVALMAAVFISVMFLPSLIAGATSALNAQLVGTLTGDLAITPTGGRSITGAASYLDLIRRTDGVAAATGLRRVGNQIAHGDDSVAQGVDAIDPIPYAQVFTTPQHLVEGAYLDPEDTEGILLGIGVAGADQTKKRTYSVSLKTVHVGDNVDVTLVGGQTHSFVVRGIYENGFPLSDQGAFITLKAADSLVPDTNAAEEIQKAFDALDDVTSAVGEAADQAGALADGANGLASALGSLETSTRELAVNARTVEKGAAQLAADAAKVAKSATSLAVAGRELADALATASDSVAPQAVAAATQSASKAAGVAQDAASLVATCPANNSSYCAAVADHAALARDAATTARTSASATKALASALERAASSAAAVAKQLGSLSSATIGLADASERLATGAAGVASGATGLVDATDTVQRKAEQVATGAQELASALSSSVDSSGGPDQASRDETLASLDSAATPPGVDSATRIVIRTDSGAEASTVQTRLEPLRGGVQFQTPAQLASAIQDQLDTFVLINNIMRVASLLVAAITVVIITYVDLTNRRRQIGIERAIGIRSAAIVGSYVLKSVLTALVGTILGWLLFRFVLMAAVDRHPFQFPSGPVSLELLPQVTRSNVVILLLVAAVAALLPAVRAVRMRIPDAIWGI